MDPDEGVGIVVLRASGPEEIRRDRGDRKDQIKLSEKTTQESRALVTAERNVLRDPRNHNMRFLHLFDSSASLGAKLGPGITR